MKKFSFSLDKVLKYKHSSLDEEKNKLAVLRQELDSIDGSIEENRRQLTLSDKKLKKLAAEGTTAFTIQSISFQIENTRRLITELKQKRQRQAVLVEHQLNIVLKATQDVNGIENLREKQLGIYQETVRKEDEQTMSELVGTQYARDHSQ